MRISALFLLTITGTACAPYENGQHFRYIADAWSLEGAEAVHRRFVDDVDFEGVPEGEPRLTYAYFLQRAEEQGAKRRAIRFDGASVVVRDAEAPWSDFWTGALELWAETESGHAERLGEARIVPGALLGESLDFDALDLDLLGISDDFATGAFDLVLRGTPAAPLADLPPLELLVSFESEARRTGL